MLETTFIRVHGFFAECPHLLIYSMSWFLILTALDLGKYTGRLAAYTTLQCRGHQEFLFAHLRPTTVKEELYRSVRLNLMLIILAWTVLYWFSQSLTISQQAIVFGSLYCINALIAYTLSLAGFRASTRH